MPEHADVNALTRELAELRERGAQIVDLTESNPTRVGLDYPNDLLKALSDPRGLSYDPHPFGSSAAREAVAAEYARRGSDVRAEQVVLSASTSEMYSWLFKLLCDPGDRVLVPRPSYPLFEHLTRLEGVETVSYQLDYHSRWQIDMASLRVAPSDTQALLVVSPNNPTGSYVSAREIQSIVELCKERGWALVADEVFAEYPLLPSKSETCIAAQADVLSFSLGGASKSLGLPQVKLAWAIVGGPTRDRETALARLELIADTFLSVATPVQLALPDLLRGGASVRDAIRRRIAGNFSRMGRIARSYPSCSILAVEGGWSAVVRVPATRDEESLILELLRQERILVHPGYFFDFPQEAYLVVSLLPREDVFAEAFTRVLRFAS